MSTNYPTSKDSLTNPTSTDKEDSVSVPHAAQHANSNDAIEALQTKLGIDSSSDTNSIDYFLKHASGTFESHNHSNNGAQIVTAGITDDAVTNAKIGADAVGPTEIAETGWGASSGEMLNFVPRTGITDYDFDLTDLTTDGTDQTLDISSVVPSSCVAVYLQLVLRDDSVDSVVFFAHPDDETQAYSALYQRIQVTGQFLGANGIVGVKNQSIIYEATNTTWNNINIAIQGWWEPAHT